MLASSLRKKISANKNLVSNFGYLSFQNVFILVLPFISFPYLINVLGKELYGILVFSGAISSYFLLIINFGFNNVALRDVSIHVGDVQKLSEIVSIVFILKGILFLVSFIALFSASLFIPIVANNKSLFFLTLFYMGINDWLFPQWYFQGIERMKVQAILNVLTKLLFTLGVFFFIKKKEDYLNAVILQSVGSVIVGVISLYHIFIRNKIKFIIPKWNIFVTTIKAAFTFFITTVSTNIYARVSKILVGVFLGMSEVATYDIVEKLVGIIKVIFYTISTSVFPRISKDRNRDFIKKIGVIFLLVGISVTVVFFLCAELVESIVEVITKKDFYSLSGGIKVMIVSIPFVSMSIFFSMVLIAYKEDRSIIIYSTASLLIYSFFFSVYYFFNKLNIYTILSISSITDIFVFIILYKFVRSKIFFKTN